MSSVCQRLVPARRLFRLVRRRERYLPQARAVGVHFPDAESGAGILAEIEEDLLGVERQADLADEALAAGQIGGPDDGPLRSRAKVVDVDAVVRKEPVGAGAVVDVRVVVIRRVGLAFDEDDLLEAQRPRARRAVRAGPVGRRGRRPAGRPGQARPLRRYSRAVRSPTNRAMRKPPTGPWLCCASGLSILSRGHSPPDRRGNALAAIVPSLQDSAGCQH